MTKSLANYQNIPKAWKNQEQYLANRQLKRHKENLAGLEFMGYIDTREAYKLQKKLNWTEQKLYALQIIATDFSGIVEFAMYPKIKTNGRTEPILEIIDWLELSFVLIPITFAPKLKLLESVLNKLELE